MNRVTKKILSVLFATTCVVVTQSSSAEEESEFSKHLQRKAADAVWDFGKALLEELAGGSRAMVFTNPTLSFNNALLSWDFDLVCDRLDNRSSSTIKGISLSIWACGSPYTTGKVDGVLLGSIEGVDLESGYGFPKLTKSISIDLERAKQTQTLKRRPQTIVLIVTGKKDTEDKHYIQGWANFAPFDFERRTWARSIE
ncbi:MAG TPA: hypothetical protein VNP98_16690 [Chthoniobacterales bacterium]|nr:hypothetical protein [Chthoniobacterales bacterium]